MECLELRFVLFACLLVPPKCGPRLECRISMFVCFCFEFIFCCFMMLTMNIVEHFAFNAICFNGQNHSDELEWKEFAKCSCC